VAVSLDSVLEAAVGLIVGVRVGSGVESSFTPSVARGAGPASRLGLEPASKLGREPARKPCADSPAEALSAGWLALGVDVA
jgi:hypothetical protein